MKDISEKILKEIQAVNPRLLAISPDKACIKPDADNWSRQQIIGHLIDSAMNNIQRFVRGGYNAAGDFPPYNQVRWVEIQGYNDRDWVELIEMWVMINRHLCQVLDRLTEQDMQNPCNIGRDAPVTLEFVAEDYVRHMKMHLGQILEFAD